MRGLRKAGGAFVAVARIPTGKDHALLGESLEQLAGCGGSAELRHDHVQHRDLCSILLAKPQGFFAVGSAKNTTCE
jgi:hypothetical protein